MNKPDHSPSHGDDASQLANEVLGEHAPAGPISVPRKILALWLAAAAVGGSVLGVAVMMVTGNSHSEAEISRLQTSIARLTEENKAVQKQHSDLSATYARMVAERRCEIIDGLDDCLAAGLKRPERFAESDRQLLAARQLAEPSSSPAPASTDAPTVKATPVPPTADGATQPAPSAAPAAAPPTAPTRKLSLGEFADELNKIPGVAVEGGAPGKTAPPADGKKAKSASKPAS
jgi:hypothetical protein